MKTFVLMGDPNSISNALKELHENNPKIKVIALSAAPFMVMPQQVKGIHTMNNPQPIPVHVLYVTFEGPDLVDNEGNKLNIC